VCTCNWSVSLAPCHYSSIPHVPSSLIPRQDVIQLQSSAGSFPSSNLHAPVIVTCVPRMNVFKVDRSLRLTRQARKRRAPMKRGLGSRSLIFESLQSLQENDNGTNLCHLSPQEKRGYRRVGLYRCRLAVHFNDDDVASIKLEDDVKNHVQTSKSPSLASSDQVVLELFMSRNRSMEGYVQWRVCTPETLLLLFRRRRHSSIVMIIDSIKDS